MSYTYSYGFDSKAFDKYATIQDDVEDMYIEDVEDEMEDIEDVDIEEMELAEAWELI